VLTVDFSDGAGRAASETHGFQDFTRGGTMELEGTDSVLGGGTLTPYEFAMEQLADASSKLGSALLARTLNKSKQASVDRECSDARLVYERVMHLIPRVRLDPPQRRALLDALELLQARLEECEPDENARSDIRRRLG
jgi:hypothetical protein